MDDFDTDDDTDDDDDDGFLDDVKDAIREAFERGRRDERAIIREEMRRFQARHGDYNGHAHH